VRLSRAALSRSISALLLFACVAWTCFCQEPTSSPAGRVTPLSSCSRKRKRISANRPSATRLGSSKSKVPTQVSTLPDLNSLQAFQRWQSTPPLPGTANSDFCHIGLGVLQDLPYPGKLRLKGEDAKREAGCFAATDLSPYAAVFRGNSRTAYFQTAYLSQDACDSSRNRTAELLKQVCNKLQMPLARAWYTSKTCYKHNCNSTKPFVKSRCTTCRGKLEAQIKQLLNRPQDSPDIEPTISSKRLSCRPTPNFWLRRQSRTPKSPAPKKMIEKSCASRRSDRRRRFTTADLHRALHVMHVKSA